MKKKSNDDFCVCLLNVFEIVILLLKWGKIFFNYLYVDGYFK